MRNMAICPAMTESEAAQGQWHDQRFSSSPYRQESIANMTEVGLVLITGGESFYFAPKCFHYQTISMSQNHASYLIACKPSDCLTFL